MRKNPALLWRAKSGLALLILLAALVLQRPALAAGPENGAQAYVLMESETGRVLAAKNPHTQLPMASTTKIMTCLLAVEQGDLNEKVTVSANAAGVEGSSMYLTAGEKLPLSDLLYGLMMNSGNDAAVAIAEHIGGSVEGFVEKMNDRARQLGTQNTHFVTPNGLHDQDHYTTAYDLAVIAARAMQNPIFREIVGTQSKVLEETEDAGVHYLRNKNRILWEYEGGNGVKTGFTKAAGRCLCASALREDMQLIAVTLNDYNYFADCKALLDYGFENYDMYEVLPVGKTFGIVNVENGIRDRTVAASFDKIRLPLTQEEYKILEERIQLDNAAAAPVRAGQQMGSVEYRLGEEVLARAGIYAKDSVEEDTYLYHLNRVLSSWLGAAGWRKSADREVYGAGGRSLPAEVGGTDRAG